MVIGGWVCSQSNVMTAPKRDRHSEAISDFNILHWSCATQYIVEHKDLFCEPEGLPNG